MRRRPLGCGLGVAFGSTKRHRVLAVARIHRRHTHLVHGPRRDAGACPHSIRGASHNLDHASHDGAPPHTIGIGTGCMGAARLRHGHPPARLCSSSSCIHHNSGPQRRLDRRCRGANGGSGCIIARAGHCRLHPHTRRVHPLPLPGRSHGGSGTHCPRGLLPHRGCRGPGAHVAMQSQPHYRYHRHCHSGGWNRRCAVCRCHMPPCCSCTCTCSCSTHTARHQDAAFFVVFVLCCDCCRTTPCACCVGGLGVLASGCTAPSAAGVACSSCGLGGRDGPRRWHPAGVVRTAGPICATRVHAPGRVPCPPSRCGVACRE